MDPPPPLGLALSPPMQITDIVKGLLHNHFGVEFTESEGAEGPNTFSHYDPYPHIFRVHSEREYLLKCSTDPQYDELIKYEYAMYQELYSLPEFDKYSEYFLEGVEGGHEGVNFILFPYIESTTLEEYLRTKPSPSAVCTILKQVMNALVFLLQNNICHGDLHAGNVLIHGDLVKIIDFDKAGSCDEEMYTLTAKIGNRKALRKNVNFIGTPGHTTGFFVLCKDIFTRLDIQSPIDSIISTYLESSDIHQAYESISTFLDGEIANAQRGKGRKKRRTQKQKRKTRSKRSVL